MNSGENIQNLKENIGDYKKNIIISLDEIKQEMSFLLDHVIGSRSHGISFEGNGPKLNKGKCPFDYFFKNGQKITDEIIKRFLYIFRYYLFPFEECKILNDPPCRFFSGSPDKEKLEQIHVYHNNCVTTIGSLYKVNLSCLRIEFDEYRKYIEKPDYYLEYSENDPVFIKRSELWTILVGITDTWIKYDDPFDSYESIKNFYDRTNDSLNDLYLLRNILSDKITLLEYQSFIEKQTRIYLRMHPCLLGINLLIQDISWERTNLIEHYEYAFKLFDDYFFIVENLLSVNDIDDIPDNIKQRIDDIWKIHYAKCHQLQNVNSVEGNIWKKIYVNAYTYTFSPLLSSIDKIQKDAGKSGSDNKKHFLLAEMDYLANDVFFDKILGYAHATHKFENVLLDLKIIQKKLDEFLKDERNAAENNMKYVPSPMNYVIGSLMYKIEKCLKYLKFQSQIQLFTVVK